MKKDTNKWKENIVKTSILPKVSYRIIIVPIKIPRAFSAEIENFILKFTWNLKRS